MQISKRDSMNSTYFSATVQIVAHVDKYLIRTLISSSLEFESSQIIPMKSMKAEF